MRKITILDRRFVPKGTLLIEQGGLGDRAYLVESGRVEVWAMSAEGIMTKLAELGPGSIFGEMATVKGEKRNANVRTLEDSIIIGFSGNNVAKALQMPGKKRDKLLGMITKRARENEQKLSLTPDIVITPVIK